ncbi:MAG: penicillin acylase family protein [Bacteroidota bacterium]
MRWIKFILSLIITVLLAGALLSPVGSTPFAFGKFFDPFGGFWENAEPVEQIAAESYSLPGIEETVTVKVDKRGVPHIFAQNEKDLFYVQGYLTAKDRLWQMEFQMLAAEGRLTEVVGRGPEDRVLELDRAARRKGITFGAERTWETIKTDPESLGPLEAYAHGVNDYINNLLPGELPIEYKLLGYKPEKWTAFKTCLLMKYMANDLSWRSYDIEHTNALSLWGKEVFETLYPEFEKGGEPIVPKETRWRRRDAIPVPDAPRDYFPDSLMLAVQGEPDHDASIIGSNNWAVAPSKTKNGHALLANDPHLGLNLPSIWYEIQLHAPSMNAYGASLPGAPGVIIGFNDSIAWGETNGSRDVLDHYVIQYRNASKSEYLHDGQWLKIENRIEEYKLKGGEVFRDTVRYTHIGPVMYDTEFQDKGKPIAVRWMAHEASNEAKTFLKLNHAHNYEDYVDALQTFNCPAQNFVFASASGDIAIWQQGKIPNKWKDQGVFVLDGSRKDHMWQGYIPIDQNPHTLNPAQGFVQSANQHPTTALYPYSTRGRYEDHRGRRLFDLLDRKDSMTVEDMKAIQLDNYYLGAAEVLPFMLAELDTLALSPKEREVYDDMKSWDYQYVSTTHEPTVFNSWWSKLYRSVWMDDFQIEGMALRYPKNRRFTELLKDSINLSYFRVVGDTTVPTRQSLIQQSFKETVTQFSDKDPNPENWTWSTVKKTDINHLSVTLNPFSRQKVETNGNGGILNATGKRTGPSWRMIVEMGPTIKALGIYPGGQSGNPGSASYDQFIDDWAAGKYYELDFMHSPDEEGDFRTLTITKE